MPHTALAELDRWRILLVEDDEDDYVLTRDMLRDNPDMAVTVDWAQDYDGAVALINERRHDLFLFDYRLGAHTGLELLTYTLAQNIPIPVILLTGHASHDIDKRAMKAGAVYYLVKSQLNAQTLERSIRYALERKLHEAALRRVQEDLERRVAERTAELQAKNRELETFTYSVSHDLKAPLRGIDGYSRLLLEDHHDVLNEEGRRFLHTIRAAVSQMNALIDDLLTYSRLERRSLVPARVDPADVTRDVLMERQAEVTAVGAEVTVAVTPATLLIDREGIAQALRNLVDNALKFSREATPPRLRIDGRVEGDQYLLSVADNGIGFDMKYREVVFGIFQRLHRAEEYPGTGVGLALVRKAAERMGGRAWAESEPGRGATFHLALPCTSPEGPR